jgi:glycosidase
MLPAVVSAAPCDWAADQVWYQIFPERFRNGCPASDPTVQDISPDHPVPGWRVTPWGDEWYETADWEERCGGFFPAVFFRRYGGDLEGIRQKLGYLQDLGVTALYLNPVFQAVSLHKYDATCLHHVDPSFGPDRAGDLAALAAAHETEDPATWIETAADRALLSLVREVHARGMRIILDGVFNHCGTAFFAFRDLLEKGAASPYAGWFQVRRFREDGGLDYAAWDGDNGSLPAFARSADGTSLAPPVKQYLFDITRRWTAPGGNPADGVDGWRLDVAYCVPHGFWKEWHAFLRSLKPDAYTTAEIVGPAEAWLAVDEFSGVMDYEWLYPVLSFLTPHPEGLSAAEFRDRIDVLHARYGAETMSRLQNLLDSHDTGRIASMLENACPPFEEWGRFFDFARAKDNPAFRTGKPGEDAYRRTLLALFWAATGPGAPMILYGTEVGMWSANDPCCRQPMFWDDIACKPETLGMHGPLGKSNPRAPDGNMRRETRALLRLRGEHPALRRGSFAWMEDLPEPIVGFVREGSGEKLFCLFNKGDAAVSVPLPEDVSILHPLGGATLFSGRTLRLPPISAACLAIF